MGHREKGAPFAIRLSLGTEKPPNGGFPIRLKRKEESFISGRLYAEKRIGSKK